MRDPNDDGLRQQLYRSEDLNSFFDSCDPMWMGQVRLLLIKVFKVGDLFGEILKRIGMMVAKSKD